MTRRKPSFPLLFLLGVWLGFLWIAAATGSVAQEEPPERKEIKLRFATFDPRAEGPPEVPEELQAPEEADAYIVQFTSAPTVEARATISELGARVHFYLPEHAHVVRMDEQTRDRVEQLPSVRWVGSYHPAYKLEEELVDRLTRPVVLQSQDESEHEQRYSIMTLQRGPEYQQAVARRIEERNGTVEMTTEQGFRLEATLDDDQLREVAQMDEVLFIDRWFPPEDDMNLVRQIGDADFIETVGGYSGEGVRGEVMDSGTRTTHQDFQATPPLVHAGNNEPNGTGCQGGNGHGTCSYGVVFGDGSGNAMARGLLPDGQGIVTDRSFVADRYAHTAELVDPGGPFRAVFQTNSWGGGLTTQYNTTSAEFDDIIFINDILITQAQSNAGTQMSRPQAWAKNVVSVGGINHLNTLDITQHAWNGGASVGPAADGRIKPDLNHFYDSVFTTSNTDDDQYGNYGGTSAATPATAGHFGLLFQMWADGVFSGGPGLGGDVFDSRPHAATAKAMMVNTASQYPFSGTTDDLTRTNQGWGRAHVGTLYELARQHDWALPLLVDESEVIADGQAHEYPLEVGAADCTLNATMAYKDPMGNPAATEHRVNDLSLRLTSPGGTVYWGNNGLDTGNWSTPGGSSNTVDTVENVFIEAAEIGTWTVAVLADEIVEDAHPATPEDDAVYALVVTTCAEVDAEVVSIDLVDPPDEIYTDDVEPLTVVVQVANNGPGGPSPAAFDVTIDATAPADCFIMGPGQVVVPVTLDVGESTEVQVVFDVLCTEPSFHTFDFAANIASTDPDVRDPDLTNNDAATSLTVGVVKQVEIDLVATGVDTDQLRAVINPVEPGEPMTGMGLLAPPWTGAGDRPLPWARTANPLPVGCPDVTGHLPQPDHANWSNPRTPITLVMADPGAPVSLFVDDFNCSSDEVQIDKTVTLTVIDGDCSFGGLASTAETQTDASVGAWNIGSAPVAFTDALTLADSGCTIRVDVVREPAEIHFELIGNPNGSIEIELVPARNGRMTGGGSVFDAGGERYTHGFQLRCDGSQPGRLQIDRGEHNRFHLATLTGVLCFEDPTIGEGQPVAGFNTILGNGLGRLNGVPETPVWFHFTDAGQPGSGVDLAEFVIDAAPKVSGFLDSGNHQAHRPR